MPAYCSIALAGHVATLSLRMPSGGADQAFIDAVTTVADEIASDTAQVRAVVVTSDDADFGTGWNTDALAGVESAEALAAFGSGSRALAEIVQPTIAALHGRVHSIGLELALACDIRVAAEDATFAMPDTAHGLVPMAGGTQRLPRAIGRSQALRLLLTGEEIDAAEALRIGLVSAVVPQGEEVAAARAIADTIASRGPLATRFAKEAVLRGADLPLAEGLRAELDMTVLLQTTADRAEGVRAFIERRAPEFTGR